MLFFWCGFLSLIVSILNLAFGYNERLYVNEQDRIIKENIYVDYLTANADALSEICSEQASDCKNMSNISEALSSKVKAKLYSYNSNIISPKICISDGNVIVYTTNHFNISRYKDSSLFNISDLDMVYKSKCSITNTSGIAVVKAFKNINK